MKIKEILSLIAVIPFLAAETPNDRLDLNKPIVKTEDKMQDLSKDTTTPSKNNVTKEFKILPSDKNKLEILHNSFIISNPSDEIKNIPGIILNKKFAFIKDAKLVDLGNIKEPLDSLRIVNYKNKNSFMLSDSSIIINFSKEVDYSIFAINYNLTLLQTLPGINAATYKGSSFSELEKLLSTLREDSKVKYVNLNLINPFIKTE